MSRLSPCSAIAAAAFVFWESHVALAVTDSAGETRVNSRQPDGNIDDSAQIARNESTRENFHSGAQDGWYGGSIVVVDLAAMGLAALSVGLANGNTTSRDFAYPSGLAALTVYAAGGPSIHAYHHNYGDMGTSIVLRLSLPFGGALLGLAAGLGSAGGCNGETCGFGNGMSAATGGVIGFGAGMIVASAIDIGGMAYEETAGRERPQVALVPSVDVQKSGAGLNLVGTW